MWVSRSSQPLCLSPGTLHRATNQSYWGHHSQARPRFSLKCLCQRAWLPRESEPTPGWFGKCPKAQNVPGTSRKSSKHLQATVFHNSPMISVGCCLNSRYSVDEHSQALVLTSDQYSGNSPPSKVLLSLLWTGWMLHPSLSLPGKMVHQSLLLTVSMMHPSCLLPGWMMHPSLS